MEGAEETSGPRGLMQWSSKVFPCGAAEEKVGSGLVGCSAGLAGWGGCKPGFETVCVQEQGSCPQLGDKVGGLAWT
jgi:hypothetical protein